MTGSAQRSRFWLPVGVLVIGVLIYVVFLRPGTSSDDPTPPGTEKRPRAAAPASSSPAQPPPAQPSHVHAPDESSTSTSFMADEDPVMPLPSADEIEHLPEPVAATPEDKAKDRERALALISDSIARLEAEMQRAEQAGDRETARRNSIRIERLRKQEMTLRQADGSDP